MILHRDPAFSFDDLLIVPQHSNLETRGSVKLDQFMNPDFGGRIKFGLPIVSAPMDTVTGVDMACAMAEMGGLGIIHRAQSFESQIEEMREFRKRMINHPPLAIAVGVKKSDQEFVRSLYSEIWPEIICIDVCHGHHDSVKAMIECIHEIDPQTCVIAGNVATVEGAEFLARAGADVVKVGIGSGSICSTRLHTGHGVPQAYAVYEIAQALKGRAHIIADGGCRNAGDIAKALALGADFVMLGSMLAATDESPGETVRRNGVPYKMYRGMASEKAQSDWMGVVKSIEGVTSYIPHKGSAIDVLNRLKHNLQAALSYTGASNISEFQKKAELRLITPSSHRENQTHIQEIGFLD